MQILITLSDEDKKKIDNCHKAFFIDVYNLMAKVIKEGKIISDNNSESTFQIEHENNYMRCGNCDYSRLINLKPNVNIGKYIPTYWCEKYKKYCNDIFICEYSEKTHL